MNIKNVIIGNYAVLAPMAGVADRAFRELCMSYGAGYCVGEMVSAKGVTMGDRKSSDLMRLSEYERPAAIQIFGVNPDVMKEACLEALKFEPDIIDINMGCPAPKIIKGGAGAALAKNPELAGKIVKAVVEVSKIPVTVKIRKGWDNDSINAVRMAQISEYNGAAAVTVHGRTREQMYAPPVDYDIIAKVKKAVNIPVIGNGDVVDGKSAKLMYETTGCDMIMVGRGALGRPWVFSHINEYLKNGTVLDEPEIEEKMAVMLKHIEKICEYKGESIGIKEARKHAVWYTKGIPNSAMLRNKMSLVVSMEELKLLAETAISLK
jgi:nifR3 family TIM-barrel protein